MAQNLPFSPLKQNLWFFSVQGLTGLREEADDESTPLFYLLPKRTSSAGPQVCASAWLTLFVLPMGTELGDSPNGDWTGRTALTGLLVCQSGASFRLRGGNTSRLRSSWGQGSGGRCGRDSLGSYASLGKRVSQNFQRLRAQKSPRTSPVRGEQLSFLPCCGLDAGR